MGLGGIPQFGRFLLLIMGLGEGAVLYVSEGGAGAPPGILNFVLICLCVLNFAPPVFFFFAPLI
jgi:hypothetical protein